MAPTEDHGTCWCCHIARGTCTLICAGPVSVSPFPVLKFTIKETWGLKAKSDLLGNFFFLHSYCSFLLVCFSFWKSELQIVIKRTTLTTVNIAMLIAPWRKCENGIRCRFWITKFVIHADVKKRKNMKVTSRNIPFTWKGKLFLANPWNISSFLEWRKILLISTSRAQSAKPKYISPNNASPKAPQTWGKKTKTSKQTEREVK